MLKAKVTVSLWYRTQGVSVRSGTTVPCHCENFRVEMSSIDLPNHLAYVMTAVCICVLLNWHPAVRLCHTAPGMLSCFCITQCGFLSLKCTHLFRFPLLLVADIAHLSVNISVEPEPG